MSARTAGGKLLAMQNEDVAQSRRTVWLFHGSGANFASGVFDSKVQAMRWVEKHGLTGIVSEYAVGDGAYDLALAAGKFKPSKPHHGSPKHVAGFSPGLDHVHVTDGVRD